MLDNGTKRRIDNARDILVGKVPDPKAQVEQITTALIYKFMDDMDQESIVLGGKASFFVGEYAKFAWPKVIAKSHSGFERLALYSEAITRMSQNRHLPQLFRDIFKGAFLPYRDPETLNLFLKEIDGFKYDNSERLGDAFEYLLSIMGSQGAAGQFRTPRHIIDFIVEVVNPTKTDTVLDPACGTAGFLISAYKHILARNQEKKLSPDEMLRLTKNFVGYDISPEMVRLSLVNMYLHQFQNPTVFEYDTLTSEERWDDSFDVILANPPFMSPKGGIRPHTRFAVQAKRSEVLFVDYIAEHLNPNGRAGVIVPEGIIFQSAKAYKALRKMLIEEHYLYAVVSMPSGVFNPYSGVKTSILLMDRTLAKRTDSILFVNIENDGYGLGAQRREIEANDLPKALQIVKEFQRNTDNELSNQSLAHKVPKSKITEDGDFYLTGNRYKEEVAYYGKWNFIELRELEITGDINFLRGSGLSKKSLIDNGKNKYIHYGDLYTLYNSAIIKRVEHRTNEKGKILSVSGDVLIPATTTADAMGIAIARSLNEDGVILGGDINIIRTKNEKILSNFLSLLFNYPIKKKLASFAKGANILHLSNKDIKTIRIPLPPLEVQQAIVDEVEGYQKIIDGARQVVENYRPHIKVDPDWPMVELGEVTKFNPSKREVNDLDKNMLVSFVPMASIIEHSMSFLPKEDRKLKDVYSVYTYFRDGDVLLARVTPCFENGKSGIAKDLTNGIGFGSSEYYVYRPKKELIFPEWIYYQISNNRFVEIGQTHMSGTSGLQRLTKDFASTYKIPLPTLDKQKSIIRKISQEQEIIISNEQLIKIFEKKIEEKIGEVWGEGKEEV